MKFSAIEDITKEAIVQTVTICIGDHFDSKDELDENLYNEEVSEDVVIEKNFCYHNMLRVIQDKIICECGKEWIHVPDANQTEQHFKIKHEQLCNL